MSRKSWIKRPPGARFVAVWADDIKIFGFVGAVVVSLLDFCDRGNSITGLPLASRARIIAELEGIASKNPIDNAIKDLLARGAITRHVEISAGEKNITRTVRYGIDAERISALLASNAGSSGESQIRDFPKVPEPGPKSGVPSYKKEIEGEAAAPRAHARGTADAAAASKRSNAKRQHPDRSRLGIECWYPSEDQEADAIVAAHDSDAITAAVAAIKQQLNGAGRKTSPVPALVLAELERQQRERDAAARRAQEDAELRVRANSEIDPTAQAKGQQLLPATLRAKLPQTTTTKEAAA